MICFDPNPQIRWLFCFTHPDDELSICVWMKRLVESGADVFVSWTHSLPYREAEARRVASEIGLKSENLFFMNGPDGSICQNLAEFQEKFRTLIEIVQPDRVACGAFEQGHLDHDSTNFLINQTFHGPIFEIPFYHAYYSKIQRFGEFSDSRIGEEITLTKLEKEWKVRCARMFPSQNIWSCLLAHEILQVCKLKKPRLLASEKMRVQIYKDFHRPHHDGKKLEKVLHCKKWKVWMASLNTFKAQCRPPTCEDDEKNPVKIIS